MSGKILIIDDDPKLTGLLEEYLTSFNFTVKTAALPSIGLKRLESFQPDLLIVDLMMPEQNGLDLCQHIRTFSSIPIIMLTAKGDTTDKIIGLEMGADDYLAKPFEPRELVARVRSQMRKKNTSTSGAQVLRIADLELDKATARATRNGKTVALTYKEFDMLWFLANKSPSIVSRDQIMNHIRGVDADVFDRSIDVMVSRIRQKLGDNAKQPKYIANVRNAGYRVIKA